jgi:hypothetical protein
MISAKTLRNTLILIAVVIAAAFLFRKCSSPTKKVNTQFQTVFNDALQVERNASGALRATIQQMQLQRAKDLNQIANMTATQKMLLQSVKQNRHATAGTAIDVTVNSSGSGKTTILRIDTVKTTDTLRVFPEYFTRIENGFRSGTILATHDSIHYEIREKVGILFTETTKKHWFKPDEHNVQIDIDNPSVDIQGASSFRVQPKAKKIFVGPIVGYGVNPQLQLRPVVGFAIGYNIF